MNKIVEIRDLKFSYPNGNNVLNGIDMNFYGSEICGICGPNGCGKTTLLKIIAGIFKKYYGDIRINNCELSSLGYKEISRLVSYVPGDINTPFDFTVYDVILMGRAPYLGFMDSYSNSDRKAVVDVSDMLGIGYLSERYFSSLSNGEKQIVLIAQSLVQKTPLILMDEPTSHLDINHRLKIFDTLKKVSEKEGVSILVVIHDIKLAADYCNRLVFIKNGVISLDSRADNIINSIEKLSDIYSISPASVKRYIV
ncbi:MAG: ABC transporter ATP-binding protein [Elusimicrobiales bacterium]|jgi:iron complex transport system ATP-binding protein|nr:ABC transporter ATP-binding protein [Elusimicrobiales bacterium]NLH40127.1 ABC transporter ATP-binding protein [Elusimicrobiota bacterium]